MRDVEVDRHVDQELLHPAQLPRDLEHRADAEAHMPEAGSVELIEKRRERA
jgi:hypothetical protein